MATATLVKPAVRSPTKLILLPQVEETEETIAEATNELPLEYQYDQEFLTDSRGWIIGVRVPWLTSPADGVIRYGQNWKIADDGHHPRPLNETEMIRFLPRLKSPIVAFGSQSTSIEGFLRLILDKEAMYVN